MLAYRVLRRILRFVIGVFFRQVDVAGAEQIPDEGAGPIIFAGNHPNSLLDPVLILLSCGRFVHFAAKDVLFRGRVMRFLLNTLGAVPVARKTDHPEAAAAGGLDNQGSFAALTKVLVEGRAMGIFPEGISHDSSQLARLKTGAARIALDVARAQAGATGPRIRVVPCGLNYVKPKRFRSRVLVQFGAPIELDDALLALVATDDRAAVRELTTRIERGMRALTVNAVDWETLRVLDCVRRLYQPPGIDLEQRTELARRFNDVYPTVKDLPEVASIFARTVAYLDRLRGAGLSDRDLRRDMGSLETLGRAARQLLLLLVWLPLAAPGIVLHAPLGLLIGWAGLRLTPRKDVIATTKLVLGLATIPLVFATILGLAWWRYGVAVAGGGLALLVLSGFATLRVLERGARLRRILGAAVRSLGLGAEVAALRRERELLEADVVRAVERLIPADMVPMFPRAAADPETASE